MIEQKQVDEMKRRLKIPHSFEDEHIKSLLEQSYEDIKFRCQDFVMGENLRGTELVYERTRYSYNDTLEYFHENFLSQITSFALENMEVVDYEEKV